MVVFTRSITSLLFLLSLLTSITLTSASPPSPLGFTWGPAMAQVINCSGAVLPPVTSDTTFSKDCYALVLAMSQQSSGARQTYWYRAPREEMDQRGLNDIESFPRTWQQGRCKMTLDLLPRPHIPWGGFHRFSLVELSFEAAAVVRQCVTREQRAEGVGKLRSKGTRNLGIYVEILEAADAAQGGDTGAPGEPSQLR